MASPHVASWPLIQHVAGMVQLPPSPKYKDDKCIPLYLAALSFITYGASGILLSQETQTRVLSLVLKKK